MNSLGAQLAQPLRSILALVFKIINLARLEGESCIAILHRPITTPNYLS
jgi:hypothetical protein